MSRTLQPDRRFAPMRLSGNGLLCGLLFAVCVAASVPGAAADDDFSSIRAAVFDYFDGINSVDRDRLERAFDPSAALKSVDESGTLVVEPIAEAMQRWMRGDVSERRGEILSIDVAGGQMARVVFDYDGAYLDFLTLAKLNGQWRIIDKVFIRK